MPPWRGCRLSIWKDLPDDFVADDEESVDPVYWLVPGDYDGIRLIEADPAKRDALVASLTAEYEQIANTLLVDSAFPPGTRKVSALASNRIVLQPLQRQFELIAGHKLEVTPRPSKEERAFCAIRGPEGLVAMRDGLLAQLAATRAEYERLRGVDFEGGAGPA